MRYFALVVFCFFLFLIQSSPACAEPSTCPYDIHLSITYNCLSKPQQSLFDSMYDAIRTGQVTVKVPDEIGLSEAEWMVDYIYNEAPELCAYDRWSTQVVKGSENGLEIHLAYKFPLDVQNQFIDEVQQECLKYANKSPADGIRLIHDSLIRRFDYGFNPAEDSQLAYFALKNNIAVCNGYAQTAAMFCHFSGYSCSYIDGRVYAEQDDTFSPHAWNVALANGKLFWFDATWDDAGTEASHEWYGLSSFDMGKTHIPDNEYDPVIGLTAPLPDDVTYSMHLDINDSNGFVREAELSNSVSVQSDKLNNGEFYAPSLVVWNKGSSPVSVNIGYSLNDYTGSWPEYIIEPESNLAFRTNLSHLAGLTGSHKIVWFINGFVLDLFNWTVE